MFWLLSSLSSRVFSECYPFLWTFYQLPVYCSEYEVKLVGGVSHFCVLTPNHAPDLFVVCHITFIYFIGKIFLQVICRLLLFFAELTSSLMYRWYSCEVSCEETRFLCQWPLQSPHQLMMHKQHELIGFCNVNSVKILRWRLQIYMVSHKFVCSQLVCEHGLREPVKKNLKKVENSTLWGRGGVGGCV